MYDPHVILQWEKNSSPFAKLHIKVLKVQELRASIPGSTRARHALIMHMMTEKGPSKIVLTAQYVVALQIPGTSASSHFSVLRILQVFFALHLKLGGHESG